MVGIKENGGVYGGCMTFSHLKGLGSTGGGSVSVYVHGGGGGGIYAEIKNSLSLCTLGSRIQTQVW